MAEKKRIAVGSDHAGFKAKETVKAFLKSKEFDVVDVGCDGEQTCDYPDFALEVAREVASGRVPEGILICGTGIGMSMAANKVAGIRAAVVSDEYTAEMSRRHNHANVFCAGARVLTPSRIVQLVDRWLSTPFEGGRHDRRVKKIDELDKPVP